MAALEHAKAICASYAQLRTDVDAILAADLDDFTLGHAYARAEAEYWRRCLASAKATGANPAFYLARLNRWNEAGERGPIGNLADGCQ